MFLSAVGTTGRGSMTNVYDQTKQVTLRSLMYRGLHNFTFHFTNSISLDCHVLSKNAWLGL